MEISELIGNELHATRNSQPGTRNSQPGTRNTQHATRNAKLRRSSLCLIGNRKLRLFCVTGAVMVPPILPESAGWNTPPISGSSGFRAPDGWILNSFWRLCGKVLTASGYPGDTPENAITWKVITMPVANSPCFKI